MNLDFGLAEMFYADWYKTDVSPHLTKEQKVAMLKKLSDFSLENPMLYIENIPLNKFPELKPYAHTKAFSGTQLYVVMSEVFNEISKTKIATLYPHFPCRNQKVK